MNELRGCQKYSMGPNFIYFGAQKYGYRPIPSEIETEELMKLIPSPQMMMVSDLPDEQRARTKSFSRRLSETELRVKQHEESIHLQGEILSFLKKTWKEISLELKESEHHWPPKICYFKI